MAKHTFVIHIAAITTLFIHCQAMVMRNNALMNKMVSHFQKDFHSSEYNNKAKEPETPPERAGGIQMPELPHDQKPEKVLSLMQHVLCKNFPSIPCNIITEDDTLRKLIEKSIRQIQYKTVMSDRTTANPNYLTLFPMVNSEDLSNFLQVREHNPFYENKKDEEDQKKKKGMGFWTQKKTHKKGSKTKKDAKRTSVYNGRKKIRKFYPHKIKYKDKVSKSNRKEFGDYSDEKLSMSVEIPDMTATKHHQHLSYKVEPADPPVWRIDYMKHGEPSLNMLGNYHDDRLKGKIMKTGPSVIVDENILEQGARKDVLHPDVYIKKNFVRKTQTENSENME